MRIRPEHIIYLLALVLMLSCEERYMPHIDPASQNLLVVDGQIDNQPGPYTVKLSVATSLNNPAYQPASGYHVVIMDDLGNSEVLQEISTGVYQTSPEGLQGIAGRKYKVSITSPRGSHYESALEELRQPTGIDSVYYRVENHAVDYFPYNVAGYRFYVSTAMAPADSTYFYWQLIDTWKYRADFNIYYVYDGSLRRVYDSDSLKTCYKTDTIQEIFGISTVGLNRPVIKDYPLHWVSTETRKLQVRYSLLVKQYSVSKAAFTFWNSLRELNDNSGDLYSKMPYQIIGNITNTGNPDETALGYFMVAGVSERRIFENKPKPPIMLDYPKCEYSEWMYENFVAISEFPEKDWPIFGTRGPGGAALPNQWCMDCRESGGVLERPDFWID